MIGDRTVIEYTNENGPNSDEAARTVSRNPTAATRGNLIEFGEHNSSQIDGDVTPAMRHTALVMAAAFYLEGALTAP